MMIACSNGVTDNRAVELDEYGLGRSFNAFDAQLAVLVAAEGVQKPLCCQDKRMIPENVRENHSSNSTCYLPTATAAHGMDEKKGKSLGTMHVPVSGKPSFPSSAWPHAYTLPSSERNNVWYFAVET